MHLTGKLERYVARAEAASLDGCHHYGHDPKTYPQQMRRFLELCHPSTPNPNMVECDVGELDLWWSPGNFRFHGTLRVSFGDGNVEISSNGDRWSRHGKDVLVEETLSLEAGAKRLRDILRLLAPDEKYQPLEDCNIH